MTVASNIYALFQTYGIFDIFAPFLVSYTLLHGTLRKSNLFKDNEKAYGAVAFAISLYFIYNLAMLQFAQRFFAAFFYFIVLIFFFLMTLSIIFGKFGESASENASSWIVGIAIPIVFLSYLYALQTNPDQAAGVMNGMWGIVQRYFIDTGLIIIIGIFVVFYILFKWFTTPSGGGGSARQKAEDMLKKLDEVREEIMRQRGRN